ncbi:hypothetical protein KZ483_15370 [Paenibacillus sp. sptzw28]|uniref:OmpL47-type beta-barrel domain-containing protein n=1 Tax=Paenibacillus sp. sptzw28 TaxID=715179 RepID=UPI001C6F3454|nr:hypothetical protein [Paenibacillus sp. sptzw28]QYR19316.1 hypothetical protein KZ483_15370 [Paenibacillus sp. sptzw28]
MKKIIILFSLLFLGLHSTGANAEEAISDFPHSLIDEVDGKILDLKGNRILFLDSSNTLKIKDRSSGNTTTIVQGKVPLAEYSFLSPTGAIFLEQSGDVSTRLMFEWRDNNLVSLGKVSRSLIVKGNYAVFSDPGSSVYLRDLNQGTNRLITSDAYYGYDVGENGLVVWGGKDFRIYKHTNGKTAQITPANDSYRYTFPLTDGINVIYKAGSASNSYYGIKWDRIGLPPTLIPGYSFSYIDNYFPYADYQTNNGYAAHEYFDDGYYTSNLVIIGRERTDENGTYADGHHLPPYPDLTALGPQGDALLGGNKYHRFSLNHTFTLPFNSAIAFWNGNNTYIADGGKLYSVGFDDDFTPPVTTVSGLPLYSNSPVTAVFAASDDKSGVKETFYRLNQGQTESGSTLTVSNEGSYELEYSSVDEKGTIEFTKSQHFTIDKTAPVTKYTVTPVYGTDKPVKYIKGYTFTLSATDALSGVKATYYRVNKGSWTIYEKPVALSGQGDQQFEFYSIDNAGNAESHSS